MNESLVSFKEYRAGEELRHLNLSLRTFVAFHAPESIPHSLRLSFGDKTIAFSGDTSWHSGLYEVARDADLFICEASCFKTEGKGHLSFKNLSEEKINFQCKQMLLTHLGAESLMNLPEIQEVFECAFDGKIIEL
jgi:ribonuclease BN (tRNA processing enzyme)